MSFCSKVIGEMKKHALRSFPTRDMIDFHRQEPNTRQYISSLSDYVANVKPSKLLSSQLLQHLQSQIKLWLNRPNVDLVMMMVSYGLSGSAHFHVAEKLS